MPEKIKNIEKKIIAFYSEFIRPNIKKYRYKKIAKLLASIITFIFLKRPFVLVVETGTICNLDCPTCPTPRKIIVNARSAKNMGFDNFKKIIRNSYKSFSCVLLYWSNEPLLNKDLVKMVSFCNKLNLYTFISTNMMLLNEIKFKDLIEAGLDEILVAFDGFSPTTYERFRKGAIFETVKKNIEVICKTKKKLKALNPWIEIQYIETKQNSNEILPCREWANEIGVDGFRVQELCIVNHLDDVKDLSDEFYTERMLEKRYEENFKTGKKLCKEPVLQVCVQVNGELAICCHDINGVSNYGNLLNDSFKSISKNKKYLELKRKGAKRGLKICKKC